MPPIFCFDRKVPPQKIFAHFHKTCSWNPREAPLHDEVVQVLIHVQSRVKKVASPSLLLKYCPLQNSVRLQRGLWNGEFRHYRSKAAPKAPLFCDNESSSMMCPQFPQKVPRKVKQGLGRGDIPHGSLGYLVGDNHSSCWTSINELKKQCPSPRTAQATLRSLQCLS